MIVNSIHNPTWEAVSKFLKIELPEEINQKEKCLIASYHINPNLKTKHVSICYTRHGKTLWNECNAFEKQVDYIEGEV